MLVDVALPLPIPRPFTYRLETGPVAEGTRVLVPFGRRCLVGWVAGPAAGAPDPARVRPVLRVLDAEPSVPPELLALCRWVADYYVAPLGQVLRAALPALLARPEGGGAPAPRARRVLRLTRELPSLQLRDALFARAPRQRACYEVVEAMGGSAEVAHLVERLGFARAVLDGLVRKGVAEVVAEEAPRDPFLAFPPPAPSRPELTPAQRAACDALLAAARRPPGEGSPSPFLLYGVTGSGKTQVYIELLLEVVGRQGRGAIVLVPEIGRASCRERV